MASTDPEDKSKKSRSQGYQVQMVFGQNAPDQNVLGTKITSCMH